MRCRILLLASACLIVGLSVAATQLKARQQATGINIAENIGARAKEQQKRQLRMSEPPVVVVTAGVKTEPTIESWPINTTTTTAAAAAVAVVHVREFITPEIAAQRLYNAWRKKNRRAALKVATRSAVNLLFGNTWKSWGPMQFKGCERNDGGSVVCRFIGKQSAVLEMSVEGGASVGGYNVDAVSLFSAND